MISVRHGLESKVTFRACFFEVSPRLVDGDFLADKLRAILILADIRRSYPYIPIAGGLRSIATSRISANPFLPTLPRGKISSSDTMAIPYFIMHRESRLVCKTIIDLTGHTTGFEAKSKGLFVRDCGLYRLRASIRHSKIPFMAGTIRGSKKHCRYSRLAVKYGSGRSDGPVWVAN